MATIAQWGSFTFGVSSEQVLTFCKMKRAYSGRWVSHDVWGEKPKMEYMGPAMQEVTLEVILDAEYGINPLESLRLFREACERGEVNHFYIGGRRLSDNGFYIVSGTEDWKTVWSGGELIRATAELTFGEYR